LKSKYLAPLKYWAGYATVSSVHFVFLSYSVDLHMLNSWAEAGDDMIYIHLQQQQLAANGYS